MELKLSDAFRIKKVEGFEWTAVMLNINNGRNKKLMEHCKILRDYAILVEKIRAYRTKDSDMEKTVTKAVDECIEKGVLKEFLLEHKSEVIEMCITEYDEEETMEILKRDYKEEGREEGCAEGEERINKLNKKLIEDSRIDDLKKSIDDKKYQQELLEEYGLA